MLRTGANATADSIIKLILSTSEAITKSYLKELILTISTVKIQIFIFPTLEHHF